MTKTEAYGQVNADGWWAFMAWDEAGTAKWSASRIVAFGIDHSLKKDGTSFAMGEALLDFDGMVMSVDNVFQILHESEMSHDLKAAIAENLVSVESVNSRAITHVCLEKNAEVA